MNLALPQFVAAEAGTQNYIIDECDFESGTFGWVVTNTDSITHGVEKFDDAHGLSYKIVVPAGQDLSTSFAYSKKADAFEHGEVTIEADFRYNTAFANINLFAVTNDNGAADYVPSLMYMDKINGHEVKIHEWHHIKYVMNMESNYTRTYIDDVLVASDDSATGLESFENVKINLTPTSDQTPVIFYIDNITIKQTQNNITADRAEVSSVEFFDLSGVSYGSGISEVTDGLFYADITMTKPVAGIPLRNRAVKAYVDGEEIDAYVYGEDMNGAKSYTYGWDHDYVRTFQLYLGEKPAPGSVITIDLTDLYDANNLKVNENCIISAQVAGEAETDVKWALKKEGGNVIRTTAQLSDGDKVKAVATVNANSDIAGKGAILVIAAYDGEKMLDMVTANVTIPTGEGTLETDYLTVTKTSEYTIKEMLILKENVTPVTDANTVTSVSVKEPSEVKNEMTVSLSGFIKYADSGYVNPYPNMSKIDYEGAKAFFADTICLVADSNFFWGLNSKYRINDKVIWYEEDLYAPVSMLNSLFGTKIYTFSRKINGKDYVSIKRAADEVLNLHADISDHGFAVISNRKFNISNEVARVTVDDMIRYIVGERPTVEMLKAATKDLVHPYLLPMDRLADIKAKILAGDKDLKKISDRIIKQAAASYDMTPSSEQTGGYYYGMVPDDVFNNYWAYYMTGDESYATKIINDAVEMANWNGFTSNFYLQTTRASNALAYVYDLFYDKLTTEQKKVISYQITRWGIYEARAYMRTSTEGWPRRENNWNTYNNAGIIISALAVREDAKGLSYERTVAGTTQKWDSEYEYVYKLLASAINGLEYQISQWGPNGGAMEGMSYFTMVINKYAEALTVLENVCGTDYSLSAVPGLMASGNTAAYHHSSKGILGLSESSSSSRTLHSPASSYFAYKTNDLDMQRRRMHLALIPGSNYQFLDLLWHIDDDGDWYAVDLPLDMNYSYSEIASSRSSWDDNATFLAVHAGQNNFGHYQFDAGNFAFHSQGVEYVADVGNEAYKTTFENGGEDGSRNRYYAARAEGQNLYVINPSEDPGQRYHAETEVVTVAAKPNGVIYKVDLTPAYIGQARKAERGYMLTEGRKVFVLQDEIVPVNSSDEYYWFWHTTADMVVDGATISEEELTLSNGTTVTNTVQDTAAAKSHHVRLTKEFKTLDLYFESNVDFTLSAGLNKALETSPTLDKDGSVLVQTALGEMNKITANFSADADKVIFRVTAVPGNMNYTRPKLGNMSGWTVEDGIRSDEYTIGVDTISNVKYGESVERFLSKVYVEKSKSVTLNGTEVTTGTLKNGMKLVADGRVLDIEYIATDAEAAGGFNIIGYTESDSVERMLEELSIVLGDGITSLADSDNVFDGLTVTADGRDYTVRTSNSTVLNSISNVLEGTPTAVLLSDLESTIGTATADGEIVYDGMTVKTADGRSYKVSTVAPKYEYNFENSTYSADAGVLSGNSKTDTGFDLIVWGTTNNVPQPGVKAEVAMSDRGSKAFHVYSDGTTTEDVTVQLMDMTNGVNDGKYKIEYWYKTGTASSGFRFTENYGGNGSVIGTGYSSHLYMHFRNNGNIYFGYESATQNYDAGVWEPNTWYHVEIEFNPVKDWRFKLKINDKVVVEGRDPNLLKDMTRLQIQLMVKAGVAEDMWLDDIRFTRIYG